MTDIQADSSDSRSFRRLGPDLEGWYGIRLGEIPDHLRERVLAYGLEDWDDMEHEVVRRGIVEYYDDLRDPARESKRKAENEVIQKLLEDEAGKRGKSTRRDPTESSLELIESLPLKLQSDTERDAIVIALAQRLDLCRSRIPRTRSPRGRDRIERASQDRISRAVNALEEELKRIERRAPEHQVGSKRLKGYPLWLNVRAYNEALVKLQHVMDRIQNVTRLGAKGGNKTDLETVTIAIGLAGIYYSATGQIPAARAGSGEGGPFYIFVKKVLDGTPFYPETVARKGAELVKRHNVAGNT